MIARTSIKNILSMSTTIQQKRLSSSCTKNKKNELNHVKSTKKTPDKPPSFMPVVNIPMTELAHNAFYSLHRPLLGLSIPRPFLAGNVVGQIQNEDTTDSEEAFLQYMSSLKPFEPPTSPTMENVEKCNNTTTTLTVEVDPSYFLNHNNNHDEIADYLTAMQEKLDLLYDERLLQKRKLTTTSHFKVYPRRSKSNNATNTITRRLRKRKGFFEKN